MQNLWILIFFGYAAMTHAQTLIGTVVDDQEKPVFAANIFINHPQSHTHSNEFGEFVLPQVNVGDTLQISSLGYVAEARIINEEDLQHPVKIRLTQTEYDLSQVNISSYRHSTRQLAEFDLRTNPVTSSQEILLRVPGLIIGQHAGGGKAEQLFLRGFDLDHGTDINISMDGMPINMVSHAHGQGYADLHFIIPEVVDRINYEKGPYQARLGNLTTAGAVSFATIDRPEESSLQLEYGKYNTLRMLGLVNLMPKESGSSGFIAIENLSTDGPFESSQNFHRSNLIGKFGHKFSNGDQVSLLVSHFSSRWNASGQIPQRAVDQKLIGRFGAIDDTEGGNTARSNLILTHSRNLGRSTFIKTNAYLTRYNFDLYSNFTFYLNDPENGDQIRQQEDRNLTGFTSTVFKDLFWNNRFISMQGGIGLRSDQINGIKLNHTLNRRDVLDQIYEGDIVETNMFAFYDASIDLGRLTINPGLRVDYFKFDYDNHLNTIYDYQSKTVSTFSPKLTFAYNQSSRWQYYLKLGRGFHSNDTRGIIASIPDLENQNSRAVPAAYGADLGTLWKVTDHFVFNTAVWYLQSEQEFIYVGDEGIVEASGRSSRLGLDLGFRAQINERWFTYADWNVARARSIDEPIHSNYIPLAPNLTLTGGIIYRTSKGMSGGLRMIHLADRPANEDYSLTAAGYLRFDGNLQYDLKRMTFGVIIQNIFNTDWNETQFATESRLKNEAKSVEEIHFTPGIPFAPRFKIAYRF